MAKIKSENIKSYIHLLRHGVTEANKKLLFYGHADIPLADDGIQIVNALIKEGIYPKPKNAVYYTSGLLRAEQTLDLIYGEIPRIKVEALMEMSFGEYEMKAHSELKGDPDYEVWRRDMSGELAPPGGESLNEFIKRVRAGFNDILDRHCQNEISDNEINSVAVCHAGVIGAIMSSYFDDRGDDIFQWVPHPGHGYTLTLDGKRPISYIAF
jgi:alpha-ribazole phosphatase